jgi:GntR family transcriptional regulator
MASSMPNFAPGLLSSEDPLYKHVKGRIVAALQSGEWKPGEMLPSEAKLASLYDVGISTVRAAVGELVSAGVVVRRQGKGTFVAVHGEQRSVYRFFNVVRDGGVKDLPLSELIGMTRATADDRMAELLELPRGKHGAAVFQIRNLLRVGGAPVVISDVTVPANLFPGLTARTLREGGNTLYAVYQRHFGVTIVKIREELKAGRADAVCAELLGIKAGEPVLEVHRLASSFNRRPVEVRRSRIDTRYHHYLLEQGDGA